MPIRKKVSDQMAERPGSESQNEPESLASPRSSVNQQEPQFFLEWEERLVKWEELLQKEKRSLQKRQVELDQRDQSLQQSKNELENLRNEYIHKLEAAGELTRNDAKTNLLAELGRALKEEMAKRIRQAEEEIKHQVDEKAREILVGAMRHGITDYIAEYTISEVKLTDADMKGRIIGREGRNIRALEQSTGVDIEIDEEEPIIRLSSFDPVRRELARIALTKLISDRRIQPARIESVVDSTRQELDRIIFKAGEDLCHRVGVYGLAEDKIRLLGRFKFRFSYGQNLMTHTLEETKIGMALAHELGADVETVRLGCLLHDVGKVITDQEGTHVDKGVELLKRNKMPQAVIDCVAQHHEDLPFSSIEAVVVYLADTISGARPGARFESYNEYVKRISSLEAIANGFKGVKEAYAIEAGRELRIIVKSEEIDDNQTVVVARELRNAIEKAKVGIPGNVKVTVIREVRAVETAQT